MAANIEIRNGVASYVENGINCEGISSVGRNQFNKVKEVMLTGVGQDMGERGTAMWALNGLTTYYQNEKNYSSDELKFNSVLNGTASLRLQKAYDLMVAV